MIRELEIHGPLVRDLLVSFLREEIGHVGFSRGVVGISGGVDSAVTAALAALALGPENVLGVMMPYRTSNPESEAHARLLAEQLGIRTKRIDISAMADGYIEQEGVTDRMRRGNVFARCRMIVLYDLSVEFEGLVVGTSNKTEILLGYSTQWGDAASALNPIGDLYKAQIFQLARTLEIPAPILEKAPLGRSVPRTNRRAGAGLLLRGGRSPLVPTWSTSAAPNTSYARWVSIPSSWRASPDASAPTSSSASPPSSPSSPSAPSTRTSATCATGVVDTRSRERSRISRSDGAQGRRDRRWRLRRVRSCPCRGSARALLRSPFLPACRSESRPGSRYRAAFVRTVPARD